MILNDSLPGIRRYSAELTVRILLRVGRRFIRPVHIVSGTDIPRERVQECGNSFKGWLCGDRDGLAEATGCR